MENENKLSGNIADISLSRFLNRRFSNRRFSNRRGLLAIVAMLSALLSTKQAVAEEYLTFLMAGQSNMVGLATIDPWSQNNYGDSGIPANSGLRTPQANVQFFDGWVNHTKDQGLPNNGDDQAHDTGWGEWRTLEPLDSMPYANARPATFGPELSFGRDIAAAYPGHKIALIKYAHGATRLDQYSGGAGDWDPSSTEDVDDYQHFRTTIENARSALAPGDTLKIAGMVWLQGEADAAGNTARANRYGTNLTNFIETVRNDVADIATNKANVSLNQPASSLPFVIVQITDSNTLHGSSSVWNHEDIVQQKQADVAGADDYAALVVTNDLQGKTGLEIGTGGFIDPWHYNAASTVEIGSRSADKMQQLVVPEPSSLILACLGFAGWFLRSRNRRR